MYVAITRARKRLYLSHAQTRLLHGQTRYNIRSRFFDEMPEASLKWITPRQPGFGAATGQGGGGWGGGWGVAGRSFGGRDVSGMRSIAPEFVAQGRDSTRGSGNFGRENASDRPVQAGVHGLRQGMKVFHTKFGEGRVLTLEGSGDDARAQVDFPRHGVKWLALSVAKLVPVT